MEDREELLYKELKEIENNRPLSFFEYMTTLQGIMLISTGVAVKLIFDISFLWYGVMQLALLVVFYAKFSGKRIKDKEIDKGSVIISRVRNRYQLWINKIRQEVKERLEHVLNI